MYITQLIQYIIVKRCNQYGQIDHTQSNVLRDLNIEAMIRKRGLDLTKQPQRILAGKRVSIPEAILKKWHLGEGDFVIVKETGEGLVIIPAEINEKPIPA